MYITQPTHGAGTRPSRTQPPTAIRKTTLNAGQCVRQPREGRGRNRQTPPPKKKEENIGGEGGGRENGPQPPNRPPTPQEAANPPTQKAPKTGPPKGHWGTTQPKPATPSQEQRPTGKRDTQNAQTHTARKKKKSQQLSPKERGWGDRDHKARDRDSQRPTPQSQSKTRKKKKHTPTTQPRRAGHRRDLGPAPTPTQHTPARKGGEQAGRAHKHTPPHSTPHQEVQETTRDGHTSTHTPQHPPKEWRGAPETQTPVRTPTPHTGTGNDGVQAERARNHARPISPTTKGGVQAETQAQPRTPQTLAGKRGTTPQTVICLCLGAYRKPIFLVLHLKIKLFPMFSITIDLVGKYRTQATARRRSRERTLSWTNWLVQ